MTIEVLEPIIQGTDYLMTLKFFLPSGAPEPQAGATLQVMVKASLDDLDADALTDITVNAADPDASLGIILATLPRADTIDYPAGTVYVQARRTLGGYKQSPIYQTLEVLRSVIKTA